MKNTYANVCNVTGTREEIVLLFGVNQTWAGASKELVIQLRALLARRDPNRGPYR